MNTHEELIAAVLNTATVVRTLHWHERANLYTESKTRYRDQTASHPTILDFIASYVQQSFLTANSHSTHPSQNCHCKLRDIFNEYRRISQDERDL